MAANPTPAIPVPLRTVVVVIVAPQRPVITDHMQVALVVLQQMKADAMVPISAQPHVLAKRTYKVTPTHSLLSQALTKQRVPEYQTCRVPYAGLFHSGS